MTLTTFIDRLDDWINPIAVKELRQVVKSRLVTVILMVFLFLMLFVMGINLLFTQSSVGDPRGMAGGRSVFIAFQTILLPTLMLVIPIYAAARMSSERSETNVDLLFISALSPSSIILGKFVAALMIAILIFSIFAPFMLFTYLLRGVDLSMIIYVLIVDIMAMLGATIFALFLGSISCGRGLKIFVNLVGFYGVFNIWIVLMTYTNMVISGEFFGSDEWSFLVLGTVWALLECFLLYSYAIALISSPSSNRMLPVRLAQLSFWFMSILVLFVYILLSPVLGFSQVRLVIGFWFGINMFHLSIYYVIATCERTECGPRIARTIPKNQLWRILGFLLYTGSAGGVLFTLIFMVLTLFIVFLLQYEMFGLPIKDLIDFIAIWSIIAVYTICYCQSAALIRYYFLKNQINPAYTWVLGLVLLAIGIFVPSVFAIIFNISTNYEFSMWMIPNPFIAVITIPKYGFDHIIWYLMLLFLVIWLALLALASIPWLRVQIKQFVPFTKKPILVPQWMDALPVEDADPTSIKPEGT